MRDLNNARETTFQAFQARVRASERLIAESDLYYRANRWEFINECNEDEATCPRCNGGPCFLWEPKLMTEDDLIRGLEDLIGHKLD